MAINWKCCNSLVHTARCVILYREALELNLSEHPESSFAKEILELCSKFYSEIYAEKHHKKVSILTESVLSGLKSPFCV